MSAPVGTRRRLPCPTAPGRRRSCSGWARCCWSARAPRSRRPTAAPRRGCSCSLSPPRRPGSRCAQPGPACAAPRRSSPPARPGSASPPATSAGRSLDGDPGMPVVLAVVFLVLHLAAPTTTTVAAGRLAGRRNSPSCALLDWVPAAVRTGALPRGGPRRAWASPCWPAAGRPGRAVTPAPWWLAGVVGGSSSAWADTGAEQWLSAGAVGRRRVRSARRPAAGGPRAAAGPARRWSRSSPGSWRERAVDRGGLVPRALATTLTGYAGVLWRTPPRPTSPAGGADCSSRWRSPAASVMTAALRRPAGRRRPLVGSSACCSCSPLSPPCSSPVPARGPAGRRAHRDRLPRRRGPAGAARRPAQPGAARGRAHRSLRDGHARPGRPLDAGLPAGDGARGRSVRGRRRPARGGRATGRAGRCVLAAQGLLHRSAGPGAPARRAATDGAASRAGWRRGSRPAGARRLGRGGDAGPGGRGVVLPARGGRTALAAGTGSGPRSVLAGLGPGPAGGGRAVDPAGRGRCGRGARGRRAARRRGGHRLPVRPRRAGAAPRRRGDRARRSPSASPCGRCPGRSAPPWSSAACCWRSGCCASGVPIAGFRARLADLR